MATQAELDAARAALHDLMMGKAGGDGTERRSKGGVYGDLSQRPEKVHCRS
jgi:hypothetical protein